MKKIDTTYRLGIFEQTKAYYMENCKIKTLPLVEFKENVKNGTLRDIQVFDFSKNTYLEFLNHFLQPLSESWAKIYL